MENNRFKDISEELRGMNEKLTLIRIEIAELKIKSSLWGFTAGSIPVLIYLIREMIKN